MNFLQLGAVARPQCHSIDPSVTHSDLKFDFFAAVVMACPQVAELLQSQTAQDSAA